MSQILAICAYCERNEREICAQDGISDENDALLVVNVGGKRVVLCEKCASAFVSTSQDDLSDLVGTPIDFPPGVTEVQHCCPELQFKGLSAADATFTLVFYKEGDYFVAQCPHCKARCRSLAHDDPFSELEG